MEANKAKEIGYDLAKCCANCKFLLRRFWARKQSTECWKHQELVSFYSVCDSFEPGSGADE